MLKILRHKNISKAVLWGILILILPAFVIWGTGSGGGSAKDKGPKFVGTINGKKVSFSDFAYSLTAIRAQIILNYFNQPAILDAFLKARPFLGKLAWDRLLMATEAKKANIKVSNDEVVNFIQSHPIFSRGGGFDDRMYAYILKNNMGLDPRAFEEMTRSNIELQKFNNLLTKDVTVSDEEVLEAYRNTNDKIKIAFIIFRPGDFSGKVGIDEKALRDYYDTHKSEFALPPKTDESGNVTEDFAAFDDVKPEIRNMLAQEPARDAADASARDQYGKIKSLMEKEKLDFAAAAAKLGLTSAETVFFSKGELIEGLGDSSRITDAALKLKPGEVSNPVETKEGFAIFVVTGSQKADEEKFKTEKADYSRKALEVKKNRYLEDWLRSLEKANALNIDLNDYDKYYR